MMAQQQDDSPFEITPQVLLKAYACGVFPMSESVDDPNLFWVEPDMRGILPLNGFHLPRRLKRTLRANTFDIRIDTAFEEVIDGCAAATPERPSTWINSKIRQLYGELHDMGHCHSVEAWQDGRLVGGLYGISLGGAFFGESMFTRVTDASKACLAHLVARLRFGGYILLDTQFVTDHLAKFGTLEIPKADYAILLQNALKRDSNFLSLPEGAPGQEIVTLLENS